MKNSNRNHDVVVNRKLERVLDAIYKHEGMHFVRTDKESDIRGVDFYVFDPRGGTLIVDEKAAAKYWNRPLETYSLELTCESTKNGFGWFAPEENDFFMTLQYMFVWVRAENEDLENIQFIELALVDKGTLQNFVMKELRERPDETTDEICQRIFAGGDEKVVINDDLKMVRCDIAPEWPINAVVSKKVLKDLAIWSKTYSGEKLASIIQ